MVLFREDEKRMKEQERQEKLARQTKLGRWIRRFVKIGVILALIIGISLILLASLNGQNTALQKGIEDYMTQATGMKAEIATFNGMSFFPDLSLDAEGLTFKKPGEDTPAVKVSSLKFSAGFFDMMFSHHRFQKLAITNLDASADVLGPKALKLDEFALKEKATGDKPALVIKGKYGDNVLSGHVTVALDKKGSKHVFTLPKRGDFQLSFGDLSAKGSLHKKGWRQNVIAIDSLGGEGSTISGDVTMTHKMFHSQIEADIKFGSSTMLTDLKQDGMELSGDITFPVLDPDDIAILTTLYDKANALVTTGKAEPIDFYGWDVDLNVHIKKLVSHGNSMGALKAPLTIRDQKATIGPLQGTINGGAVSGKVALDAQALPAKLNVKTAVKKWDIGHYQKATQGSEGVSATANVHISLAGKGRTFDDLLKSLKGEAVLIAGEGKFASAALNIWGGGLVNAMMPSLDKDSMTKLNCMIADFKVDDGIATPAALFMDTERLTVVGDGTIDIPNNKIDLQLEPKAKNPALLDVSTAVNIKGPILNPDIGSDGMSLLGKLGGLALGLVNPAFLAISMTDIGLTESHPCYKFIGKPKEAAAAEEKAEETKKELQPDDRMAGAPPEDKKPEDKKDETKAEEKPADEKKPSPSEASPEQSQKDDAKK